MSRELIKYIFVFSSVTLLVVAIWDIEIIYYPTIGIAILGLGYLLIRKNLSIDVFDIILFVLLSYEFINYFYSLYKPNTYIALRDLFLIVIIVSFIKRILINYKLRLIFFFALSSILLFLSSLSLGVFLFRFFEASYYGFDDFSQFRHLYTPLELLSNEWVTLSLSFIPLVVLTFFYIKKSPLLGENVFLKKRGASIFFIIMIMIILSNIFVSFSRGGYIAFFTFQLLLSCLLIITKTIPLKTIFTCNLTLFFFILLLSCYFSFTIKSTLYSTTSHNRSIAGRIDQWSTTRDIIKTYPFWGIGSKNYSIINESYKSDKLDNTFTGRVNSTFVQIIIEKGIIGSIIYLIIFIIFVYLSIINIFRVRNNYKMVNIIAFSSIISIIIRELFFSSLFYNNGLLIIFLIILFISIHNTNRFSLGKRASVIFTVLSFFVLIRFAYTNIVRDRDLLNFQAIVKNLDNNDYKEACTLADKLNLKASDDALLFSIKGLAYERAQCSPLVTDSFIIHKFKREPFLLKALENYSRSIELNPFDDICYHNLGWIYYLIGEEYLALSNISKAIELNPNSAIYYISRGLIFEAKNNIHESFKNYKQAIKLSPDITDSKFFEDLKIRNDVMCKTLLNEVLLELNKSQENKYSSIVQAKIGKILLDIGNTHDAKDILLGAVKELPSLNRSWYYLGLISEKNREYDKMLEYYNKALFLERKDFLPHKRLSIYYADIKDNKANIYYKKTSLIHYEERMSENSSKSKRKYYRQTVKNDIIPLGLLSYVTPKLN